MDRAMTIRLLTHLLIVGVFSAGCGGDDASSDAGLPDADAGLGFVGEHPMLMPCPEGWTESSVAGVPTCEPWDDPSGALVLTPCPPGWREATTDTGVTFCDPWPATGRQDCPVGEAHFPGEPGCVPVGSPCPAGEFPDGVREPALYVRAGATGGDGTMARPYGSIQLAADLALAGTTIAVAKGTYRERVQIPRGIAVLGACARETHIVPPTITVGVVQLVGPGASLSNVHVGDGRSVDVTLEAPFCHLNGVDAEIAIRSQHESAEIERVIIRNGDGLPAAGLAVGRSQSIRGAVVLGASLLVQGGAVADLSDVALDGGGFLSAVSGSVHGRRIVIENSVGNSSVRLADSENESTFEDLVIRHSAFAGLDEVGGSTVTVRRALLEANTHGGVRMGTPGGRVILEHVIVRDTPTFGINVGTGTTASLSHSVVERNVDVGVLVTGVGTSFEVSDTIFREHVPRPGDLTESGIAIQSQVGASVTAERILVERNFRTGLFAAVGDARMVLRDSVVRDTIDPDDSRPAAGVQVQDATVTIERSHIQRTRGNGIVAILGGSHLDMSDVVISEVGLESAGRFGVGIQAVGGETRITRVLVHDAEGHGLYASGPSTLLSGEDVVVSAITASCATPPCGEGPVETGVAAYEGGTISLTRFDVRGAGVCGVYIADGTEVDLRAGVVTGCGIGACVQDPDYTLDRLTEEVLFRDNGTNLDTTMLPLPDPPPEGSVEDPSPP